VAVLARGRDEGDELVDQLERGEHKRALALGPRSGQLVNEPVVPEGLEALEREGRAGAVAEQALQARAVLGLDAHRAVEGEAPAARPAEHLAPLVLVQPAAPGEPTQDPAADGLLSLDEGRLRQVERVHLNRPVRSRRQDRLDHAQMKMDVGVERRAKAMDEAHRPDSRSGAVLTGVALQRLLDDPDDDVQHRAEGSGLALEDLPQALGHRHDPLTHGQARKDVVDQVRGGLRHPPRGAGRTERAALAGKGDQIVPTTGIAMQASEAVGVYILRLV
jgi:hypothetical protein